MVLRRTAEQRGGPGRHVVLQHAVQGAGQGRAELCTHHCFLSPDSRLSTAQLCHPRKTHSVDATTRAASARNSSCLCSWAWLVMVCQPRSAVRAVRWCAACSACCSRSCSSCRLATAPCHAPRQSATARIRRFAASRAAAPCRTRAHDVSFCQPSQPVRSIGGSSSSMQRFMQHTVTRCKHHQHAYTPIPQAQCGQRSHSTAHAPTLQQQQQRVCAAGTTHLLPVGADRGMHLQHAAACCVAPTIATAEPPALLKQACDGTTCQKTHTSQNV